MKPVFMLKSPCSYVAYFLLTCKGASLLRSLLLICYLLFTTQLFSQTFSPYNPAKFGIDGDLSAEQRLQGSFIPAGTHDWFKQNSQTGYGVFDTLGASVAKSQISSGQNYSFSKKMAFTPYSIHDGLLMLDGTYSRDYFAIASIGANSDKTAFLNPSDNNNKSYTNPSAWTTAPSGAAIPAKSNLIDTYIHMRRNGTSISETAPSNLFVYFAASTLSTNGDHYLDFELFKSDITYNATTGSFSNSGPITTGGRSSWEFNSNGSIKVFGDMSLSFSFSSTTVSEIAIYIWVPYSVYTGVNPTGFDFVAGSWAGNSTNSGYGYAKIQPNAGNTLQAWGTVNQTTTAAPVWGTNSSNIGSTTANNYSTLYSVGQLAEAAIDLTSLGIDPALSSDYNRCAPPYIKVLVKSRSSSSFSSTLQDFVTPFAFLNSTEITSQVVQSNVISCATSTATLTATNIITGASYSWSTMDGNITAGQNSSVATINQPGTYTLSSAIYTGCPTSTTTIRVNKDGYQPVATAGQTGALTSSPDSFVTLHGGDEVQSNYTTPFGSSQGLLWNWTGPEGFISSEQHPKANKEGAYQLVVAEKRNGCTDTAIVHVIKTTPLALKLQNFSGSIITNRVELNWKISGNDANTYFEILKSSDGISFYLIGIVFTSSANETMYTFSDTRLDTEVVHYRLKMISGNGQVGYSKSIRIGKESTKNSKRLLVLQNHVPDKVLFTYVTATTGKKEITLYNTNGMKIVSEFKNMQKGNSIYSLYLPANLRPGVYLLQVYDEGEIHTTRFVNVR